MQIVYYFEEPTIGYCTKCDCIAVYIPNYGLECPVCGTNHLSIFTWDNTSEPPE